MLYVTLDVHSTLAYACTLYPDDRLTGFVEHWSCSTGSTRVESCSHGAVAARIPLDRQQAQRIAHKACVQ